MITPYTLKLAFCIAAIKKQLFFLGGGGKLPSQFIIKIWIFKVKSSKPPKLTSDILFSFAFVK